MPNQYHTLINRKLVHIYLIEIVEPPPPVLDNIISVRGKIYRRNDEFYLRYKLDDYNLKLVKKSEQAFNLERQLDKSQINEGF
ncbi:7414_t:CDS:2 [Funneliformis mosseae]|uniref:7414_t:CDS:1 n=1 Tax=Funneliformis mosseae TaxID=27381 RepID=A0A9N9GLE9_FUNMO|nr:7414_t:CDS:2 [Funneliformis mosseae]